MRVRVNAIEYCLPERTESIEDIAREYPEWPLQRVAEKTGVLSRHVAEPDETASDLGVAAAHKLFASGVVNPDEIDFLLFCTQTPDYILPTSACVMQTRLGIPTSAGALDFNLGCSGFVYGLGLAKGLILSGQAEKLLLITADTYNRLINPGDRSVRTVFGDAGAATLICRDDELWNQAPRDGLGPFVYGTDGTGAGNLCVPAGGMRKPYTVDSGTAYQDRYGNTRSERNLFMNGRAIYGFALDAVPRAVTELLERADRSVDDIDCFIFHQASAKVLSALQGKLNIPPNRFFVRMHDLGNTVSCTIPIALIDAARQGLLKPGDLAMLVGFGVGYSWGATILRWG